MAPQPYTTNGRLTLQIDAGLSGHRMRFPCVISTPVTLPSHLVVQNPPLTTVPTTACAQAAWDLIRPMYAPPTGLASYVLEQNFSGTFVPVDGAVLVGIGTAGGSNAIAGETTFSFKSAFNHALKLIVLESGNAPPYHKRYPTTTPVFDNFMADVVNPGVSSHLNNWVVTRGGEFITRGISVTIALNKAVRRSRGLV